jgi:hypothetical protein
MQHNCCADRCALGVTETAAWQEREQRLVQKLSVVHGPTQSFILNTHILHSYAALRHLRPPMAPAPDVQELAARLASAAVSVKKAKTTAKEAKVTKQHERQEKRHAGAAGGKRSHT